MELARERRTRPVFVKAFVGFFLFPATAIWLGSWVPTPLPLVMLPIHWVTARWFGKGARWYPIALAGIASYFGGFAVAWYLDGTAARHGASANEPLETAAGLVLAAVVIVTFERTTRRALRS